MKRTWLPISQAWEFSKWKIVNKKPRTLQKIWGSMQFFIVTSTHSYHQVIRYAYVCIAFLGVFNFFSVPDIYSNWNELSNWATSTPKCENRSVLQSHAKARYSGCEKSHLLQDLCTYSIACIELTE